MPGKGVRQVSFNHADVSIAFLRSICLCFSFSKSTEAPYWVGFSQRSGPPVVPDMRNDLLETSQDVKPTVPPQPEDSPSEEILLSVPFHLPIFCWLGTRGLQCLNVQLRQIHPT